MKIKLIVYYIVLSMSFVGIFIPFISSYNVKENSIDTDTFIELIKKENFRTEKLNIEDSQKNLIKSITKATRGGEDALSITFIEFSKDLYARTYYYNMLPTDKTGEIKIAKNKNMALLKKTPNFSQIIRINNTLFIVSGKKLHSATLILKSLGIDMNKELTEIIRCFGFSFVLILLFVIVSLIPLAFIFKKAGKPFWAAFVPIYNMYCVCKLGFGSGWMFLWVFLPYLGCFAMLIAHYELARKFNKSQNFSLSYVLFYGIVAPILALDDSKYIGSTEEPEIDFQEEVAQLADNIEPNDVN